MLSPTPGTATILGTSNIQFQWSSGAGVTSYELLIGTNGVGSSNILATAPLTTTSYTVPQPCCLPRPSYIPRHQQYSVPVVKGRYVTSYELLIGTSGVGSSDILATAPLTTPSYTVPALPADGVTLFVRLGSLINGAWQTEDYVYTESGPATLSPSSGTLSTSQLFTWSNGNEATYYQLVVRSDGPGSPILFDTGVTTETSATVNIPANGATVIATLYQLVNGRLAAHGIHLYRTRHADSGHAHARLGHALNEPDSSTGATATRRAYYQLVVQSDGPGSPVLFHSGLTMETSATVNIPANGATVTVWLYQLVNDVWQRTTYTFTAPGTRTAATLTPASGTLSTSQLFDWGNGNEAIYYHLQLGTKGPGSTDLLGTGLTTETSVTVSIPANGKKVFAVLYQLVDDVWQHTDYTFTEP